MTNINGSIGFTFLKNKDYKILVLADMHSTLPYCNIDGIFISEWLKKKYNSKVLLEEVPRHGNQLKELWPSAPHTQKLKDMYLQNSTLIQGIDVRPFLLPFSWELIFDKKIQDMTLRNYLNSINLFYNLKLDFFRNDLKDIYNPYTLKNTPLGIHYLQNKQKMKAYVRTNKKLLSKTIHELYQENQIILEEINNLISDIMEWYMIAKIFQGIKENKKQFIIHAGLAHTTNVIKLLKNNYMYEIISDNGVTSMNHIKDHNGCLYLPSEIENQFGGFLHV